MVRISFARGGAAERGAGHPLAEPEEGRPSADAVGWLRWMRRAGNVAIGLGMAGLTTTIAAQWRAIGYPPFSNVPESLLWMAWGFCAVYFVARIFVAFTGLEFAASLGVLGVMAFSTLFEQPPARSCRPCRATG